MKEINLKIKEAQKEIYNQRDLDYVLNNDTFTKVLIKLGYRDFAINALPDILANSARPASLSGIIKIINKWLVETIDYMLEDIERPQQLEDILNKKEVIKDLKNLQTDLKVFFLDEYLQVIYVNNDIEKYVMGTLYNQNRQQLFTINGDNLIKKIMKYSGLKNHQLCNVNLNLEDSYLVEGEYFNHENEEEEKESIQYVTVMVVPFSNSSGTLYYISANITDEEKIEIVIDNLKEPIEDHFGNFLKIF